MLRATLTSNGVLYIKWADAEGKVLGLQSARLVVRTAQDVPGGTTTRRPAWETKDVNRGLGTVEYYLTGGKGRPRPFSPTLWARSKKSGYLNTATGSDGVRTYELHTLRRLL